MLDNSNVIRIIERVLNKIDFRLINHGHRVAYCMMKVLESLKCDEKYIRDITIVSLMHDIGAYKTEEIDQIMYFETDKVWEHSIYGYLFLKYLSPIPQYDQILLYHHLTYQEIKELDIKNKEVIQLLYLIDRIDIYWHQDPTLENIESFFQEYQGTKFSKEIIDIFKDANKKYQILEKVYLLKEDLPLKAIETPTYDKEDLLLFLRMISFTIDFRSHYMIAHCVTTASICEAIADIMELDTQTKEDIYYGAMLHDIGKVATPLTILNANGKLNVEEMAIMKEHVLHTIDILQGCIKQKVVDIAGRHHEHIDGSGYPLGLSDLDLTVEQKIVVVADILSALVGKRSYKEAYSKDMAITIVKELVNKNQIDETITNIVTTNYDEISETVKQQCQPLLEVYQSINQEFLDMKTKIDQKRMFEV